MEIAEKNNLHSFAVFYTCFGEKIIRKKQHKIIEGHSEWILHEMYCVRYIRSTELEWSASGMEIGIPENRNAVIDLWLVTVVCFVVTHFDFTQNSFEFCDDDKE